MLVLEEDVAGAAKAEAQVTSPPPPLTLIYPFLLCPSNGPFQPYTLSTVHPSPCTLYTLHPIHPAPYTPYTLSILPTLHPSPYTPYTLHPTHLIPQVMRLLPSTPRF